MSDLNTSIRQGDMHGAVLIYGEEPYMRDHYINSIISAYVDDAMKDFNLIHVSKYESLPQLMSLCENFPMMSDKKVVIAYDTKLFAAKKSEGSSGKSASSKDDGKQFEEFLKNIPEFCIMVFVENDVNRTKKTFKLIEKYGVTENASMPEGEMLEKWVAKRFAERGKRVVPDAITILLDYSSESMYYLDNQIEKISTYALKKDYVDVSDVVALCGKTAKAVVFEITDSIGAKNPDRAIRCVREMLQQNEPVQKLLVMVFNHIQRLRMIGMMMSDGMQFNDAAATVGIKPGFPTNKTMQQINMFSNKELKEMSALAQEFDILTKTSSVDEELLLDLFTAMCAIPKNQGKR